MSGTVPGSTQPNDPSGDVDVNANSRQETVSYETHRKLLSQLKKKSEVLDRLEAAKNQSDLERQKLEGDKDGVIKQLENDLGETKQKLFGFVQNSTKRSIKSEAIKEALARGIQAEKIDKFWKLSQDSFLGSDELQVDENFDIVNKDAFGRIMDAQVTDNQDWFTRTAAQPRDITPGTPMQAPKKDLDEMSTDELAALL